MLRLGVREHNVHVSTSEACRKYFNQRKVTPTKYMVQLSATMEQTYEMQLTSVTLRRFRFSTNYRPLQRRK